MSRDYVQLKNCSDPIGNGVLFPDVTKAVRDAKAIGDVTKKISKKQPAPKTESFTSIQQAEDNSKILQTHQKQEAEIVTQVRFTAGTLQHNVNFWKTITNNRYVLNIVFGYAIEFNDTFTEVMSSTQPLISKFDKLTSDRISAQVDELLSMHAVKKGSH